MKMNNFQFKTYLYEKNKNDSKIAYKIICQSANHYSQNETLLYRSFYHVRNTNCIFYNNFRVSFRKICKLVLCHSYKHFPFSPPENPSLLNYLECLSHPFPSIFYVCLCIFQIRYSILAGTVKTTSDETSGKRNISK